MSELYRNVGDCGQGLNQRLLSYPLLNLIPIILFFVRCPLRLAIPIPPAKPRIFLRENRRILFGAWYECDAVDGAQLAAA